MIMINTVIRMNIEPLAKLNENSKDRHAGKDTTFVQKGPQGKFRLWPKTAGTADCNSVTGGAIFSRPRLESLSALLGLGPKDRLLGSAARQAPRSASITD